MIRPRSVTMASLALGSLILAACGTASPGLDRPIDEPKVDRPGEHLVRYRGPQLEAVVSFKYAATRIGEDWLILQVGIGGMQTIATEVRRDAVFLETPDRRRIPIIPHEEFSSRYSEIAAQARQAAVAAEPLAFSRPDRRGCPLGFMPLPGTSIVLEAQHVDLREFCQGLLYFPVPGGVQPGRYELVIELEEREAELPFTLS